MPYYVLCEEFDNELCEFPHKKDMLEYVKDLMEDNGIGLKDIRIIKGEEIDLKIVLSLD
jgi:hypothetical protein